MATKKDYYTLLGVEKTATPDQLKRAYRKLAIQYHPDKNPGNKEAEEKFKEIAEAYDVLSDPERRKRYDQFGHAGVDGSGMGGFSGAGGFSMDDIFSRFGDIFGDAFGFSGFSGGFGGGTSRGRYVQRGSDLRIRVKLTLSEIAHGVEKKIKVKKNISCSQCNGEGTKEKDGKRTCSTCNGSGVTFGVSNTVFGQMRTQTTCPTCNGKGEVISKPCDHCHGKGIESGEEQISFNIPAGVSHGMQLTLSDKGNAAPAGGRNGDLLILVEEIEDANFIRNGNDLIYNLLIPISMALKGGKIEVPTIDGKARITIEPGTNPGKILRLKGKGLPTLQGFGTGDILVNVNVFIPKDLSAKDKELVEQLEQSNTFAPTEEDRKSIDRKYREMLH